MEMAGAGRDHVIWTEHAGKSSAHAEGHAVRAPFRSPTRCLPARDYRCELGAADGGDFFSRPFLSCRCKAVGRSLGDFLNGAAVRTDAHASVWLWLGRFTGHPDSWRGVRYREGCYQVCGCEFPGARWI